jgi:outer membrane murein-binding lipoprotein Lpp
MSLTSSLRVPAVVAVLLAGALLAGCGHPASREECDELFAKNAEIELRSQRISDPKVMAERIAAARAAEGDAFAQRCLGRRITKRAIECVRRAQTAEQVDRCL